MKAALVTDHCSRSRQDVPPRRCSSGPIETKKCTVVASMYLLFNSRLLKAEFSDMPSAMQESTASSVRFSKASMCKARRVGICRGRLLQAGELARSNSDLAFISSNVSKPSRWYTNAKSSTSSVQFLRRRVRSERWRTADCDSVVPVRDGVGRARRSKPVLAGTERTSSL